MVPWMGAGSCVDGVGAEKRGEVNGQIVGYMCKKQFDQKILTTCSTILYLTILTILRKN